MEKGGRKKNLQSSQTLATEAGCMVDISALLSGVVSQVCLGARRTKEALDVPRRGSG